VLRFVMEQGAKGCEVIVSGKLRAARAKSMKFKDGYMVSSGHPKTIYVDGAVRHVLLRQGVLGIKVRRGPLQQQQQQQQQQGTTRRAAVGVASWRTAAAPASGPARAAVHPPLQGGLAAVNATRGAALAAHPPRCRAADTHPHPFHPPRSRS
jgi:hypothetical protein